MCVQFFQNSDLQILATYYDAIVPRPFVFKPHVFPRYLSAVLIKDPQSTQILPMAFGLIPFFERNEKPKKVFHNARLETLTEKVSFKGPFFESRCLIPMNCFFEYIWTSKTEKWLAKFFPKDRQILTAAGIYQLWRSPSGKIVPSYALVTTEPSPFIRQTGHDRSPLFLKKDVWTQWLEPQKKSVTELYELTRSKQPVDFDVERIDPS